MTNDDNLNPYDNVPSDVYMKAAISAVSSGQVCKDVAIVLRGLYVTSLLSDTKVIALDYTSATIT